MLIQTTKNSGQGSHFRNDCGGFCMITIERPSPGSYDMEIWKDIPGYEGLYQASNYGNIKSFKRRGQPKDRIRKPMMLTNGYRNIDLSKHNKRSLQKISRLVATSFIPNPENKLCVNHKDGNKLNDKLDNIEWCTHSENQKHAYKLGLKKKVAKLNEFQVRVIRKIDDMTNTEIAKIFNVKQPAISQIKNYKRWTDI